MHSWRPARPADIPRIADISSIALAGYPEEEAVFEELIRLAPEGAHVLEVAGAVAGYLLGHPWRKGAPPALNTTVGTLPAAPDCWYIHDLSLLPEARGFGAARQAVAMVEESARAQGYKTVTLVAVNGAGPFWKAQGFVPIEGEGMAAAIAGYGADALYMEKPVALGP